MSINPNNFGVPIYEACGASATIITGARMPTSTNKPVRLSNKQMRSTVWPLGDSLQLTGAFGVFPLRCADAAEDRPRASQFL